VAYGRERAARVRRALARRANRHGDEGMSLVEIAATLAIFSTVVVSTQLAVQNALSAATIARDHTVATSLVSTAIYQAEALPFSTLQQGVDPTTENLCNDPNITCVGSTYYLRSTGAVIAACGTAASASPIIPHTQSVSVGGTIYMLSAYPTVSSDSCSSGPLLVTLVVVVTWHSPSKSVTNTVTAEVGIAAP
jgi:hypothetical protein